ncbi:glycosyltransferase [Candidatus Parcubacteria bacterium]|nr:glycosyltransferase [Candidatus Parcubacteria bacterium]
MLTRVILVHDFLLRFGGAEQVLKTFHGRYPEAPIFTLAADPMVLKKYFPHAHIHTSWLQSVPSFLRRVPTLAPFIPMAVESLVLPPCDLVISSAGFVKGVLTKPETIHISYVHAPVRYLWDAAHEYLGERRISGLRATAARSLFHYLRLWDRRASERAEILVANSRTTQRRIAKYYRRHAAVIYPPVRALESGFEIQSFDKLRIYPEPSRGAKFEIPSDPYDLIVSTLRDFKRIDLAVTAYTRIKRRLVVVGEGPILPRLERLAGPTVQFLGWQPEAIVSALLSQAKTFILPAAEDFGIAAVEAMRFGVPVLALRAGGATETVLEGVTGEFFDAPVAEVLLAGLRRLEQNRARYSPLIIRQHAERFSGDRFIAEWDKVVDEAMTRRAGSPAMVR